MKVSILSIGAEILDLMKQKSLHLALVESCTGGLIAERLTAIPGASQVLWGGWVVYSNEAKQKELDVRPATLEQCGAVSAPIALELVEGASRKSGAEVILSVTGIAGPGGGTLEKPVGLVFIAFKAPDLKLVFKFEFQGDRDRVREVTLYSAFSILWDYLNNNKFSEANYFGLQEILNEV